MAAFERSALQPESFFRVVVRFGFDSWRRLARQRQFQVVQQNRLVGFRLRVAGHHQVTPSVVGSQTSSIWMVESFSNTALGVSPGAKASSRFFSVTHRQ